MMTLTKRRLREAERRLAYIADELAQLEKSLRSAQRLPRAEVATGVGFLARVAKRELGEAKSPPSGGLSTLVHGEMNEWILAHRVGRHG